MSSPTPWPLSRTATISAGEPCRTRSTARWCVPPGDHRSRKTRSWRARDNSRPPNEIQATWTSNAAVPLTRAAVFTIGRRVLRRQHPRSTVRSGGVYIPHGQADAALAVHFQHLHADHVAFLELVADALDALVRDLRDVHQAIAAREDRDEGAEVHQAHHLALVDAAHFDVRRDELDAPLRFAARLAADRRNLDGAVALDVDGRARLFGDLADDRPTLADDVADLLRVDLDGDDRGRPLRHVLAGLADDPVHLIEDVQTAGARLIECHAHDLRRHAFDLDVHLERGHAIFRAGDLEVHVTEMIFVTEDVGEHLEAAAFEHETHRHAGDGRFDRHSSIHQRQAGAADARHAARTVRFENFRHDADDIREFGHVRHHGVDATPGEIAVADLAALRRPHHAGLTDRERWEVVVKHERLAAFAFERVDDLRIARGTERRHHERLGLATREERRAMRPRQHAHLHGDRTHGLMIAAVDARLAIQHTLAHDVALELEQLGLHLILREL